jgi:hypothetical protein
VVFGQGHAIVAWALIAPVAALLLTVLFVPLLRTLMRSSKTSTPRFDGVAS